MVQTLGLILGVLFTLVGGIGLYVSYRLRPLHQAEVELIRRDKGKLDPSEPDWLGEFRITQSEFELEDNGGNIGLFGFILLLGVVVIIILL